MPLHEYKTQVLLLHSEQSTLDNLSSEFSDRYTVHCATSGSEALNTLVETPINVIVTAQDLPGMSGLEALREAKKRSPDTVGILLAGNADDGLEALVGDKEVFQIVRGNITGDAVTKLVDDATRQMRLMALAESANDTTANVDEPTEHIVMETSENGATIISDGTGRMPALDPQKVSAAASVGAQSVDILVLTKDQEFLSTIKDSSRGMHTVHYATTLAQADETIRQNTVGVAVVDAAMVGNKVEQLTQHLRKGQQRLVSIVAGRRDDGEMLMDLINRGKVYRFLLKPVSPGRARLAVEASVKHHLEAPDSAFKAKGGTPTAKPATKPQKEPKAPKGKAKPAAPKKELKPAKVATPPVKKDPPLGTPVSDDLPPGDRLDSAFDDDSSFTETVTGLIASVGKKFSADEKPEVDKPATAMPPLEQDESPFRNPRILGGVAAAVVVLAGVLFWAFSGSDEPEVAAEATIVDETPVESTPLITESQPEPQPDFGTPVEDASVSLIEEARLARDAGRLFNPPGSNALELYAAAIDAGNVEAPAEFGEVIAEALSVAETAMLDDRLADAEAALQRIAVVDPNNVRLPFLMAQLSQMQLRGYLADARSAILEGRFEDAANSLASARALQVADDSEIELVAGELDAAQQAQQADEVLALANARLEEGDLLSPANDNARYYYQLVLRNDPQNPAARQGLTVVANKLVLQARAEIDNANFAAAEGLLDDARAVDPENVEVTAAAGALASARDALLEQQRREEARREAERIAAEERVAAERRAAEERVAAERRAAEERAAAERRAAEEKAAAERAAEEQAALAAAQQQQAAPPAADNTSGAVAGGGVVAASVDQGTTLVPEAVSPVEQSASGSPAAQQTGTVEPQGNELVRVGISSLNRTKYVAPKYPRSAERRSLSGWVDVVFTVTRDGKVKDIVVRDSKPGDTFVNAATRAVERWEFEPIIENGATVERRTGVRMMFAVE